MEPRDLTRGNCYCYGRRYRYRYRFNGATRSHAWKHGFPSGPLTYGSMLQWSHAISRVETNARARRRPLEIPLQWSHAISRVETRKNLLSTELTKTASMEPRDLTRGNGVEEDFEESQEFASMEPRDLTRGNSGSFRGAKRARRSFNGATRSHAWKRVHCLRSNLRHRGFNGATRSHAWKPHENQPGGFIGLLASMEPRDLTRGNDYRWS